MIHDLTDLFLQALAHKGAWDAEQVSVELASLIRREGGDFAWGRTSGEEWMALDSAGAHQYALVWTHAPLAIIHPQVSVPLRDFLEHSNALLIEADDWHAVAYSIEPAAIRAHGVPDFWPLDQDDPTEKAFSILDLYDVTNN